MARLRRPPAAKSGRGTFSRHRVREAYMAGTRFRPIAARQPWSDAALQDPQTGRSPLPQRKRPRTVCYAEPPGRWLHLQLFRSS